MKVLIAGASGFIGKALCEELCGDYEIIALSRDVRRTASTLGEFAKVIEWDGRTTGTWVKFADGAYAIINLAGEPIASGKWTHSKKAGILHSRLDTTRAIVSGIKQLKNIPSVVIQASAIGYYGPRGDEELTEKSPSGKGFLAEVCKGVELCTEPLPGLGVRLVVIRTGVVLGKTGGALPRIAKPFKYFLGGHPGSGKQWFSWIAIEDEIAAIKFLMENEKQQGAFNLTSPEPLRMKQFCRKLGRALKSPSWTFVPGFILRKVFGEMADEMILSGQKVLPEKLLAAGFEFKYPEVEKALRTILID
ncbi:MAG: TIGR01777 family oxidoreductase [Sedimentisphaerales bacterium]|nr:TIGR01777 family oxidoreductase [Sedimentisphaerales bacterium]